MLKGMILASYSSYNGQIGDVLNQWKQVGVFDYMLPFLMIFALIYGILTKINIFSSGRDKEPNKTINGIIALAVGLMALQFDFVSIFFAEIFPRMGVGIAILLVILILSGLFMDPGTKWVSISFYVVGLLIAGYALVGSAEAVGWLLPTNYEDMLFRGLPWIVIIGLILAVVLGGKAPGKPYHPLAYFEPNAKP